MRKLFDALANIFRVPELRKRLLFTLGLLAVYRLGSQIPTPGIDVQPLEDFFDSAQGSIFGFFDLFAGGNLRHLTVFALGIMPYISASIILQILAVVFPRLEKLQKEGELGRRKITQWTRYLTIALALVQGFSMAQGLMSMQEGIAISPGFGFAMLTMLSLTAGTAFVMWLGEQISERGVGNGMSLIIFTGIVVRLPSAIASLYTNTFVTHEWGALTLTSVVLTMAAVVALVVLVERGERRVPVQYATRILGRRAVGGRSTYMPLKVNAGGVIPVIFASSILALPQTLANFSAVKQMAWLSNSLRSIQLGEPLYYALFVAGILFFSFFYVSIIMNPSEAADNMRKYGGFIPGIRPGRHTADFLNQILTRLTVIGGVYLAILCLIPDILTVGIKLNHLPLLGNGIDRVFPRFLLEGLNVRFPFSGTSLLIVVGVALDTISQIEAHLLMRHYDGFTPRSGRIRGRRNAF